MIASIMMVTTPPDTAAQPSSDLRIPSSVEGMGSAHGASGQEYEDVHQEPGEQQQPDGQPRQRQRAARHLRHDALQRLAVDLVRRRIAANPRLLGMARGRHAISRAKYPWSGAPMRGPWALFILSTGGAAVNAQAGALLPRRAIWHDTRIDKNRL